jgi:hypothetical protein
LVIKKGPVLRTQSLNRFTQAETTGAKRDKFNISSLISSCQVSDALERRYIEKQEVTNLSLILWFL